MDANMNKMLELSDQDFETAVMKMLEQCIANCLRMEIVEMENTIPEICGENKKTWICSTVEWRQQRIELVSQRADQYLLNLKSGDKIDFKKKKEN